MRPSTLTHAYPQYVLITMPATHGVVRLFTCRGFTFLIKTLFDILMDLQFGFLFDFSKLTPYFTRISTPAAITVKSPSSCGNRTEKTCKMMNPDTKITTVIFVLHNVIAHCLHRVLRYASGTAVTQFQIFYPDSDSIILLE